MNTGGPLLMLLVGCWTDPVVAPPPQEPATEAPDWKAMYDAWQEGDPLPDFELVDQDGKTFRLGRYQDSWLLVGFVYTRCQNSTACPLTMTRMAGVQSLWTGAVAEGRTGDKKLQLLTLTFDASRDTPADFKAYGNQFGVDFDLWTLATGPDELLNDAIPSLFGVLALPLSNGEITHSVKVGLLKPGLEMVAEWPDNAFLPGEVVEHVLQP